MSTYRYCANIDLDAFEHNISQIKKKLAPGTKLCCVIKANAYGHGSVELAGFLEKLGVDYLATACVDEALELRFSKIDAPILILGETDSEQFEDAVRHRITLTIFNKEDAKKLSETACRLGMEARVHIKLDTGMSRIGFFSTASAADEIAEIAALPGIAMEGLFTHFACADMEGREKTETQIDRYRQMLGWLSDRGVQIPVRHCANSAGIMEYDEVYMDMVRAGIIIYGLYPSDEISHETLDLRPVMSLKSHVTHVKTIGEGVEVSYGGTFKAEKDTVLATIPVGYADGYLRALSNKGSVLIRGKRAPIRGRVCMDQFMVDVTDIPDVSVGDEVTLVGTDGDAVLSVEEVSGLAGSFNYEFVCDVARRVPRVYYRNGEKIKTVHYLPGAHE